MVGGEKELHSEREGARQAQGSTLPPAPQDRAPRWPPGPAPAPDTMIQKSVLYICVSFSVLYIGLSLTSF